MRRMLLCFVISALAACSDSAQEGEPYVEFAGGGFVFNYRLAEADYGFVARVRRRIPSGTVLEARFEDPAGGAPLVVTQTARWGRVEYVFRSPPVRGVEAGREYRVELRLLEPGTGRLLGAQARTFRAELDQEVLPERAPVVGPGYRRAPSE